MEDLLRQLNERHNEILNKKGRIICERLRTIQICRRGSRS